MICVELQHFYILKSVPTLHFLEHKKRTLDQKMASVLLFLLTYRYYVMI